MRLSGFHKEIAKLMAEGLPNREIKTRIKISDSRLSVLRANPVMQREIEQWKKLHDDKYRKALDVFAANAEQSAKEIVMLGTHFLVPHAVRLSANKEVLEQAARLSDYGQPKASTGSELVFEQLLKVTKRVTGQMNNPDAADDTGNMRAAEAYGELLADLEPASDDIDDMLNVSPAQVSFVKQVRANEKMPSVGDNGGSSHERLIAKLREMRKH